MEYFLYNTGLLRCSGLLRWTLFPLLSPAAAATDPRPCPPSAPQVKNITHHGNITMGDILEVARIMRPRSCAKTMAGTVKEILGTAVSVGCTVDRMKPAKVQEKVRMAGSRT